MRLTFEITTNYNFYYRNIISAYFHGTIFYQAQYFAALSH